MGSGNPKQKIEPPNSNILKLQNKKSIKLYEAENNLTNPIDSLPYEVISCFKTELSRKEKQLSPTVYKNFGKILQKGQKLNEIDIKISQTVSNGSTDLNY